MWQHNVAVWLSCLYDCGRADCNWIWNMMNFPVIWELWECTCRVRSRAEAWGIVLYICPSISLNWDTMGANSWSSVLTDFSKMAHTACGRTWDHDKPSYLIICATTSRTSWCGCVWPTSTTWESLSHLLRTVCMRANTCCRTTTTWKTQSHFVLKKNKEHKEIHKQLQRRLAFMHDFMAISKVIYCAWVTGSKFPVGDLRPLWPATADIFGCEGCGVGGGGYKAHCVAKTKWPRVLHYYQTTRAWNIKPVTVTSYMCYNPKCL